MECYLLETKNVTLAVLDKIVGHLTLFDQVLKLSELFYSMVRHLQITFAFKHDKNLNSYRFIFVWLYKTLQTYINSKQTCSLKIVP